MVEWDSYEEGFVGISKKKHYQGFTNKEEAEEFRNDLERAHKLLGNKCYSVTITKQKSGL